MSDWTTIINDARAVNERSAALSDAVSATGAAIISAFRAGNKLLSCGNGGSASQSGHLVAELLGRFKSERDPLPAVDLASGGSLLTCLVNDYDPADVFARQVSGLGAAGDVLVALTTTGNSENVRRAVVEADRLGLTTVALLGKGGGALAGVADFEIIVPSDETARIQEIHLLIIHAWCAAIDAAFPK